MRKESMKKLVILIIGLFVGGASVLPSIGGISPEMKNVNTITTDGVKVTVQNVGDLTQLQYSLETFTMTPVIIDAKEFQQISLGKESQSLIAGAPDLPSIHRSIIIPNGATMGIRIIGSTYQEFKNVAVAPSKGNLLRTVNPADVPYEFGEMYTKNTWYPSTIVELQEPYYLRDFRGQVVTIHPFQYNPVEATLRFYNTITVEVFPIEQSSLNSATEQSLLTVDSDFLPIYETHFINFNKDRYTPVSEQGNMLVIVYNAFYYDMVPFVQWKNMKGIPTEMVNVTSIGTSSAIKTYITDYYNTKGLTFVLLVGDAAQVPTYYQGSVASDPSYGYIVGSDHYADLFVGRFSAENIAQVQTQANRTISYERDPQAGAEWYTKGVGIASSQGVGDDNEYDYEHIRNIRALLLNFTYTFVDELYDGSQGGGDASGNPTPAMVATAIDDGRSIINYCGHGSPTSWGTSGFSNSNVNSLTNDNMLPFIVSVACNNGEFDDYTCFAEAWLRATHNGQPIGAIGAYMSTISQSWDPPMEAQDEFNNILIGMYSDNQKTTFGALCYHGAMSMIDKYGSSGSAEADAWTVFGDPSLQVRTDTPTSMDVDHDHLIQIGATTYELDVLGVKNALCAISADGVLYGYGYSDASGHAVVNFFEPIEFMPEAQLVVTAFNKIPYMATLQVGSSYPPDIPTLDGPNAGCRNKEYPFTAQTTDPEGDNIYYLFDWGDGSKSEWIGPVTSGEAVIESHVWTNIGLYNVTVRAKDENGSMSRWCDPLGMHIDVPVLNIALTKGKLTKISAVIQNLGFAEADNVSWKISLDGGVILLGKEHNGTISTIPARDTIEIQSGLIFGFGQARVTIKVESAESTDTLILGKTVVMFFFVFFLSGGG
jgi:hypothetical protein